MPRTRPLTVLRTAILAALALTGCMTVNTRATRLGMGPSHPPVAEQDVAVYSATDQIPGKYENVALLVSSVEHRPETEAPMLRSMRKRAGELGANAVLVHSLDGRTRGEVARALQGMQAPTERKGTAIAIFVYPSASATRASASPF
jgi:hypothetical protein